MVEEVKAWDIDVRDTMIRIARECAEVDGQAPLDEAVRIRLRNNGLIGSTLWLEGNAGFALRHDEALELAVVPGQRAKGIGGALAAAALEGVTSAWSHGDHPAAARLAARHGFSRARELWVMRRPVTDLPPTPDAVTIRTWTPDDRDELLRVNAEAFRTHPEQGDMDAQNLTDRMAEPWFDAAGLLVVTEDERMLGFHWTKKHSAEVGEVYVVATDPAAQGRGLGRALTVAGLHHLRSVLDEDGEIILYVESDNARAVALYESLGFTHAAEDTHVQYRR
ncbi:mycothiol synthase [Nocardioides daejeonensis]|uniref:mycothiol synthase n=1 Tax=Nocardioides daejeonensis TaxID=1046556 RepID=UPI000D743C05|nr:mycothiol synthase [Nocardioides daejeonensis]